MYSKFQKFVPFDPGSKSPLSPLFQRGERFRPIGVVVAIGELMRLHASLRPPFTKGGQGDFYCRILPCQSEHINDNSYISGFKKYEHVYFNGRTNQVCEIT